MSNIHIYEDFSRLSALIPQNSKTFVIIDNNLKPFYKYFEQFDRIEIHTDEKTKTLATVENITEQLLARGADRNCFLLGVGGGILTDICGFTGSVYKRGVKFAFVPTTLLAQVDASIGGKNGVNFHSYKNMIGTITQPEWIYACTDALKTLPPREFKAGIAEVLKTFILFDGEYYQKAVSYFTELEQFRQKNGRYTCGEKTENVLSETAAATSPAGRNTVQTGENTIRKKERNGSGGTDIKESAGGQSRERIYKQEILTDIIRKTAAYKCGVVERDPFEKGERRLLNLGHTFAHAIEKNCTIMHGEAVGIGLVLAARISRRLGMAPAALAEQLEKDLQSTGLPTRSPVPAGQLLEALEKDKKVDGDNIHFILPRAVGKVTDETVSLKKLEEISRDLC